MFLVFASFGLSGLLQLFAVYLQLMIIVGLCFDSGKSWTSQFFKTRVMQFLGRISMSLYLTHEPLIYWLKLAIYGPVGPNEGTNLTLPNWAIPIHITISMIFGILLTLFIAEPAREFLKKFLAKRKAKNKGL